jgi:hypothetical protein
VFRLGARGNLDAYLTATRRGSEDAPVELLRNFDRFTFFERLANAFDQAHTPFAYREMLSENALAAALNYSVEVIGNQRVKRTAAEHSSGRRRIEDPLFNVGEKRDFAHLRFLQLVTGIYDSADVIEQTVTVFAGKKMNRKVSACGTRKTTVKIFAD